RIRDALRGEKDSNPPDIEPNSDDEEAELELDASLTFSRNEILTNKDFEKMTSEELALAKQAISRLKLPINPIKSRRFTVGKHRGLVDAKTTMKASTRRGSDIIHLKYKQRKTVLPPIVVLCDISGSMEKYSRMLLHFLHSLTNDQNRVHSFVFGTRLTNISRYLRFKDPDQALEKIGTKVDDWSGGTRIGSCLHDFNKNWSRRVLGQGALVLLITDGLDRFGAEGVETEMERLHKSSRKLIWLNPLLRYSEYEPLTKGARAMINHVDELRSIHNLSSMSELAKSLSNPHMNTKYIYDIKAKI
ncbi:MAG: VWA domain-containing protein, partial [Alphaproteobacteria bacterium]|nr:VWA domain-containing protein [Alphaproteobacteria bacterium]